MAFHPIKNINQGSFTSSITAIQTALSHNNDFIKTIQGQMSGTGSILNMVGNNKKQELKEFEKIHQKMNLTFNQLEKVIQKQTTFAVKNPLPIKVKESKSEVALLLEKSLTKDEIDYIISEKAWKRKIITACILIFAVVIGSLTLFFGVEEIHHMFAIPVAIQVHRS